MKREKKYYVIKVKKEHKKVSEQTLLKCLIDRYNICFLEKAIKLHNDEKNVYFIISGEEHACRNVISIAKHMLKLKDITLKATYYDAIRSTFTDELLWSLSSNEVGIVLQDYTSSIYINYVKNLTTKFVLKKSLMARYAFCSACDGVGEYAELTSLKGVYKCPLCDCEMHVEGPIITGKQPISHLSTEEQEALKDLNFKLEDSSPSNGYQGEQISIILNEPIKKVPIIKVRRKPNKLFSMLSIGGSSSITSLEQISWDI